MLLLILEAAFMLAATIAPFPTALAALLIAEAGTFRLDTLTVFTFTLAVLL